jgi:transglutaminase-like putative cysteine protease
MRRMRERVLPLVAAASVATAVLAPAAAVDAPSPASRSFEFKYAVRVQELPKDARRLRLWIPVPTTDGEQEISDLTIKSPVRYRMREEAEYHDHLAYLEVDPRRQPGPLEIELTFKAVRREHRASLADRAAGPAAVRRPEDLSRSLAPDRLVPLDGLIARLASEQTKGLERPLDKARAIYDYVLSTMRYDKTGEGWGRGDVMYACNARKGNCTDFHALFIGMMRATGIPARFEIGFPLPRDKTSGEIGGYHCWAEFWVDDLGWVPVDASEGWKDPARRDYFFGAHDANRILFTRGRDIRLDPAQRGEPLNYLVYPYAELDGEPWAGVKASFSFTDLEPTRAAVPSAPEGVPGARRAAR